MGPYPPRGDTASDNVLLILQDLDPEAAEPVLPAAVQRLVDGIRDGSASDVLPPIVVPGPDNTLAPTGAPCGAWDARLIAWLLAGPRFTPMCGLLTRLHDWSLKAAARFADILTSNILTVTNAGLFGSTISEVFIACATGPPGRAASLAECRAAQTEA
jgi:hypothetical protein